MRPRTGFTLIELLVVVAIMGLLGTIVVGGYRQMRRGMEERGVMENVNQFMHLAYERAKLDRRMVMVYLWNETLRLGDENEAGVVVGRAVAVRSAGRVTAIDRNTLLDEFGDLEQYDDEADGAYARAPETSTAMRLYLLDGGDEMKYSLVGDIPQTPTGSNSSDEDLAFVTYNPKLDSQDKTGSKGRIVCYGHKLVQDSNAEWKVGAAYGFEFASLELPHGYIFGQNVATDLNDPIREVRPVRYLPDATSMPTAGRTVYHCILQESVETRQVGAF